MTPKSVLFCLLISFYTLVLTMIYRGRGCPPTLPGLPNKKGAETAPINVCILDDIYSARRNGIIRQT